MRTAWFLIAFGVASSTSLYADSPTSDRRDKALKGIEACLRSTEVSSRQCKSLNKDAETLVDLYRQGDKSVLPTLLRYTPLGDGELDAYLTDLYDVALTSDPEAFLTAVSQLSEPNQQAVATRVSGGMVGLPRPRFEAVRTTLREIPDSSPNYRVARKCLLTLETENASFLVDYFPPQTFKDPGDFLVHWFSREFYALEAKPLWPPASETERTFRITVLPAFAAPESVTLIVLPDNSGQIRFHTTDSHRQSLNVDRAYTLSSQQIADFTAALNRIQFWQLPIETPQLGHDGAEWILEGVQDGRYHIVHRWCPGKTPFGEAARNLFDLARYKSSDGDCWP